nr:DUF4166 domain-containing protein [Ruegeria arenilitoris]
MPAGTELSDAVRALHSTCAQYSGRCTVTAGGGKLVALALRCARMPPDGQDVEVKVSIVRDQAGWIWTRNFGGHITQSRLNFDHRFDCVREQFGPVSIWLKPVFSKDRLSVQILRLKFLGVPCPKLLLPRSTTVEWQDERGRFRFDVSAEMPVLGPLIRYQGWLTSDHGQKGAG